MAIFFFSSNSTPSRREARALRIASLLALMLACALAGGCARWAKKFADREVYGIIDAKFIEGMPTTFTIERTASHALPTTVAMATSDAVTIKLVDAIEIAVENSRDYQTQKETLFMAALDLTLARHQWDPLFSGDVSGEVEHTIEKRFVTDPNTGRVTVKREGRDAFAGALNLGVKKMLATGGDVSFAFAGELTRVISAHDTPLKGSTVNAGIIQPLLKGAGMTVALENIRQAERDMGYAIRTFVYYRQKFSVSVALAYFDLLQQKKQVANALSFWNNMKLSRERAESMAQAGRVPQFEVDQRRQRELSARDDYLSNKQSYENALDQFNILLGLSPSLAIDADSSETERMTAQGLDTLKLTTDAATSIAFERRLDLRTIRDKVADAERKVKVAENGLLMRLDANASWRNRSTNSNTPLKYEKENMVIDYGLSAELPLDKKADRNIYRQSLIDLDAARRAKQDTEDRIQVEIIRNLRQLEQTESSYLIQSNSLKLAERRVDSTTMLQMAGRASTRDVLDSQESYLSAQNSMIRTLFNHARARLNLFIAMGALRVDDQGLWEEDLLQ
ncbi:MAG: TolC family protein [Candidatus Sumerlaeota bacterium]|nr:TolC family protein [Candidatus Sumerlaeota bacterium]